MSPITSGTTLMFKLNRGGSGRNTSENGSHESLDIGLLFLQWSRDTLHQIQESIRMTVGGHCAMLSTGMVCVCDLGFSL